MPNPIPIPGPFVPASGCTFNQPDTRNDCLPYMTNNPGECNTPSLRSQCCATCGKLCMSTRVHKGGHQVSGILLWSYSRIWQD